MARPKPEVEPVPAVDRRVLQTSTMLPPSARTLLSQAAAVDPGAAPGESIARSVALDRAIQQVKFANPKLFRQE